MSSWLARWCIAHRISQILAINLRNRPHCRQRSYKGTKKENIERKRALQNVTSRHEDSTGLGFQSQLGSLYETSEIRVVKCVVCIHIRARCMYITTHRHTLACVKVTDTPDELTHAQQWRTPLKKPERVLSFNFSLCSCV